MDIDATVLFKFNLDELKKEGTSVLSEEYARLLDTLRKGGFQVAGKRTSNPGELLVCLSASPDLRSHVMKWEKSIGLLSDMVPTPANRSRALYAYIISPAHNKGLGISPSVGWPHVQAVVVPRPADYRIEWLKWIKRPIPSLAYSDASLDTMAQQYGVDIAMYFAFLSSYTSALTIPAVIGTILWFSGESLLRPYVSIFIIVWALFFLENWRNRQSELGSRWKSITEHTPPDLILYTNNSPWWKTELKTALSIPLIGASVLITGFNMSVAFILEAFIMRMYNGPFQFLAPLVPTIYNVITTPPFVVIYTAIAAKITTWEAHLTRSSHDTSLLLKVAPVNAMVAFFALFLSAGLYVPFGEELMHFFHLAVFSKEGSAGETFHATGGTTPLVDEVLNVILPKTMPHTRLSEQLFSFAFVLQLAPLVAELIIPLASRWYARRGKDAAEKKTSKDGKDDEVVERVALEASLPEHNVFDDYLTLTMQFGYVVMWTTAYPLTPVIIFLLSIIRLRIDALKILVHFRYTPTSHSAVQRSRVWTSAWSVIIWFSALVNVALITILDPFIRTEPGHRPKIDVPALYTRVQKQPFLLFPYTSDAKATAQSPLPSSLASGAVTVLVASYAVMLLKLYVAHLLRPQARRAVGSDVLKKPDISGLPTQTNSGSELSGAFWTEDEGNSEIWKKAI